MADTGRVSVCECGAIRMDTHLPYAIVWGGPTRSKVNDVVETFFLAHVCFPIRMFSELNVEFREISTITLFGSASENSDLRGWQPGLVFAQILADVNIVINDLREFSSRILVDATVATMCRSARIVGCSFDAGLVHKVPSTCMCVLNGGSSLNFRKNPTVA